MTVLEMLICIIPVLSLHFGTYHIYNNNFLDTIEGIGGKDPAMV